MELRTSESIYVRRECCCSICNGASCLRSTYVFAHQLKTAKWLGHPHMFEDHVFSQESFVVMEASLVTLRRNAW
jgi:hypothetical protein